MRGMVEGNNVRLKAHRKTWRSLAAANPILAPGTMALDPLIKSQATPRKQV